MHEITFHTSAGLFELYRGLSSVLNQANHEDDSEIPLIGGGGQQEGLLALKIKQKELTALLKYADLGKFVNELKDNKNLTQSYQHLEIYNSELFIIEKALASEITFLFYINLLRNKFLDYTDEGRHFLGDERDTRYQDTIDFSNDPQQQRGHILRPADFLRIILKSDNELKNMFLRWMADIRAYRQKSLKYMEEFEQTIKIRKNRSN